jgi:hypothetical protein
MKTIFYVVLSCAWISVLGASTKIEQATVTLPYSELASLIDRVHVLEQGLALLPAKPPVDVIVRSAQYRLDCVNPVAPQFQVSFEVANLSDEWQSVLLLEASEAIRSVEPVAAKLVQGEGGMHLLLEPGTTSSITLGLQSERGTRSRGGLVVADFLAIGAAQSLLTIIHDSDPDSVIVTGAVTGNEEKTEFCLPASGQEIKVMLYEPEALMPTRWRSEAKHFVRDAGGEMEVFCHLRLQATDGGRTSEATLSLPNEVNVVTLAGIGEARQSTEMTADGSVIHLNWPNDDTTVHEFFINYTLPVVMSEGRMTMPALQVVDAIASEVAYYFTEFDGLELNPVSGAWSKAGRLPAWVVSEGGELNLDYYALSDGEPLMLSARVLPRLQAVTATVRMADYSTEVVAEGGMLHQGNVTVEHGSQADYEFTLPETGKLLACTVNGLETEPIVQEDGSLRLIMPRGGEGGVTTEVGYAFTTKGGAMNPVEGKVSLALPHTPLFIRQLTWAVQLPSEYQATALEGNVVIDAGGTNGKSVRLSKQICDDETPIASLYYTRRDLQR